MPYSNNSRCFYKIYFNGIDWTKENNDEDNKGSFERKNERITKSKLPTHEMHLPFAYDLSVENCIELETTYPGLIVGSGINHGSGRVGEIKLGLHLDYTSGLPTIPGSSIKGTIRSVWPLNFKHEISLLPHNDKEQKQYLSQKYEESALYIQSKLKAINATKEWNIQSIENLEKWIFGSFSDESNLDSLSKIIFHDAIPVNTSRVKIDNKYANRYLGIDYITPHKSHFQDPIPISFLKVLPGGNLSLPI